MEKEFFETSDIELAAALLTNGHNVSAINPVNPKRVVFLFDVEDSRLRGLDVKMDENSYWNRNLSVDARSLFGSRQDLLTRIKEAERLLED